MPAGWLGGGWESRGDLGLDRFSSGLAGLKGQPKPVDRPGIISRNLCKTMAYARPSSKPLFAKLLILPSFTSLILILPWEAAVKYL